MQGLRAAALGLTLLASAGAQDPETQVQLAISSARARETVAFLADDAREGREAGSAGFAASARYAAAVLRELGLEPAGSAGYAQPFEADGRQLSNVLAALPGDGTTDEAILIGAHLDHLGRGGSGSMALLSRGQIHNGADDNASGVAAVLEVARGLVAAGVRPRRRIVFALFDGEERGLLGSKHLAAHPCFPERLVLMLNLDMVGRLEGPLTVAGAESGGPLLSGWLADAARAIDLQVRPERAVYPNSDHYPFYEREVPVLVPFTGLHRDYHRPSDDLERVNADGVAQVARLAAGVALRAARAPRTPTWVAAPERTLGIVVEQALAFLRLPTPQATPRLGVRLDGLVVESVEPESPAARAGLAPGDRLLRARGRALRTTWDLEPRPPGRRPVRRGWSAAGRPTRCGCACTPPTATGTDGAYRRSAGALNRPGADEALNRQGRTDEALNRQGRQGRQGSARSSPPRGGKVGEGSATSAAFGPGEATPFPGLSGRSDSAKPWRPWRPWRFHSSSGTAAGAGAGQGQGQGRAGAGRGRGT
ncbi:MAG: M20/M25/M40 family metallo-hydrolase [Planctomycetota bacterium]